MKKLIQIIFILGISYTAHSQLAIIPTGTRTRITDVVHHNDTLILSGGRGLFAKSYDMGRSFTHLSVPGPRGYYNFDFQVVGDYYYILSIEGAPYNHNMVLKSIDYGLSWQTLCDHWGLFTELTMLDTAFGVMGETSGTYAMTRGSDTAWVLDSVPSSYITGIEAYGDSTILMLAFGHQSHITEDRGQTWQWVISGLAYNHQEIQFLDKDTIYSVAHKGKDRGSKAVFHYSTNGGHNWSTIWLGYNPVIGQTHLFSSAHDLYFDSPRHGYILGYNHRTNEAIILETNDYGIHWAITPLGITEQLYDMEIINDSIGFLAGENGTLVEWNRLEWARRIRDTARALAVTLFASPVICIGCGRACVYPTVSGGCPPYTYDWTPHNPNFPACNGSFGTTYTVVITDACGNTVTDSLKADTIFYGTPIDEPLAELGFSIYPNPAQDKVVLELEARFKGEIILTNLIGKQVKTIAVNQSMGIGQKLSFSVKEFSQGVYFVTLNDGEKKISKKLIIKKLK